MCRRWPWRRFSISTRSPRETSRPLAQLIVIDWNLNREIHTAIKSYLERNRAWFEPPAISPRGRAQSRPGFESNRAAPAMVMKGPDQQPAAPAHPHRSFITQRLRRRLAARCARVGPVERVENLPLWRRQGNLRSRLESNNRRSDELLINPR